MFQPVFVENPDGPPFLLPVFLGTHVVVVPDVAHDELQVLQHALLAHGARVVARLNDVILDVVPHPLARLANYQEYIFFFLRYGEAGSHMLQGRAEAVPVGAGRGAVAHGARHEAQGGPGTHARSHRR